MNTLATIKALAALLLRTAFIWDTIVVSLLAINDFATGISLSDDKLFVSLYKPVVGIASPFSIFIHEQKENTTFCLQSHLTLYNKHLYQIHSP